MSTKVAAAISLRRSALSLFARRLIQPGAATCGCSRMQSSVGKAKVAEESTASSTTGSDVVSPVFGGHAVINLPTDVSEIETRSVAKGLFVNKFNMNMINYPEFSETEDVLQMEEYCASIERFLRDKVDSSQIDKEKQISEEILYGLRKLGVFGLQIPKEFGGAGVSHKQYARVCEVLSRDFSILTTFMAHHDLATRSIMLYGTQEQKAQYLPRLASGESIGAFCLHEENSGHDIAAIQTEGAWSEVKDDVLYLHGSKHWVTNGSKADILVVFGKVRTYVTDEPKLIPTTAFVVDRKLHEGVKTGQKRDPIGLRGADICDLHFDHISLPASSVLGTEGDGFNVAVRTIEASEYVWGSVAAGCIKRLLGDVAKYANNIKRFDKKLSETNSIKKRVGEMTLAAYAAESMTYYVAGLLDEDPTRDIALEGSIIKAFSRQAMRDALQHAMQIMGARACSTELDWERHLRDLTTLSSFIRSDDYLNGLIAMTGVLTIAAEFKQSISKLANPLKFPWDSLKSKIVSPSLMTYTPQFKHYIIEHVHPSLGPACHVIEETLAKFESIVQNAIAMYGKTVEDEHFFLERISVIIQTLFAMLACISRASRSYCIGLRNSTEEIGNANTFCLIGRFKILHVLNELNDRDPAMHPELDRMLKSVAETIFKDQGYLIENPLQRNW